MTGLARCPGCGRTYCVCPRHLIQLVSSCSQSVYVACDCGEKMYGATEREARDLHIVHRTQ
jgi:hypothetical protein